MVTLQLTILLCSLTLFFRPSLQVPYLKRSNELSIVNQVNQTGHCTIAYALSQVSKQGLRKNWRADIKYEVFDDGGIEKHIVTLALTAPPPKPVDYELFHGVGFYKFHAELKTFRDGMNVCASEGGHLLIVNSPEEAKVAGILYERYPKAWDWANIGFYDQNEDGKYETIFGKPLESTGYSNWYPNEPDHSWGPAYCGLIHRHGLLGGGVCNKERPFICEYDLSWGVQSATLSP